MFVAIWLAEETRNCLYQPVSDKNDVTSVWLSGTLTTL